ncbi:GAF domain-containing protein [Sphingobacterium corticibacter]|uniref:GAF domain-containing protein n=1 Tax=Sphingobacterium corticibacter TaxID=2171749 RepID=A0A2T8HIU9_9SPHI|nr:GAF domain-containing protein [Sphingobacterium corticibacter]PVH25323.1 hypothetical protein DC487_10410 [Sphingobacterium corticibacter]
MPNQLPLSVAPSPNSQLFNLVNEQELRDIVNAASTVFAANFSTIALLDEQYQYNFYNHGFEVNAIPIDDSVLHRLQQGSDLVIIENVNTITHLCDLSLGSACSQIQFYAGIPLQNKKRQVLGYLCVYHDKPIKVTNTKRLLLTTLAAQLTDLLNHSDIIASIDDKLTQWDERLIRRESLFNSTKIVTLLLDKNFTVLKCHPLLTKLICDNLNRDIRVGDDIREYIGDLTIDDFVKNFYRALEGQSISVQSKSGICWGGLNSYSHFTPAYDLDGELVGVSYHALPIFPENTDESIKQKDDQQLQWINDLQSHRFRGPLSSILGITQIWKELGSTPLDAEIDMIIQAANKLDREIQSALFNLGKD